MTEQQDQRTPEEHAQDEGLHPNYREPEADSVIMIRFAGNTAQVADARFRNVDPFQLKAAAWWLERHAEKSLTASEQRAAQMGLSQGEPEGDGPPKPSILKPDDLRG